MVTTLLWAPLATAGEGRAPFVGVKSPGQDFVYAEPNTRISANDLLIVSGHAELLERLAARP